MAVTVDIDVFLLVAGSQHSASSALAFKSIVLHDARGPAAVAESHFSAAAVQTRPPPAMLEVRSSWQMQLTTADFIPQKNPTRLTCVGDVVVFRFLFRSNIRQICVIISTIHK